MTGEAITETRLGHRKYKVSRSTTKNKNRLVQGIQQNMLVA